MNSTLPPASLQRAQITLGVLAGGRATRLGGIDKAWIERGGVAQVLRWRARFAPEVTAMVISANRDLPRYQSEGLHVVADRVTASVGPLAGLDALASACLTPWMLTLPVDLVGVNDCLVQTLVAESTRDGAMATDDDGPQPLVALWRVVAMRQAIADAMAAGEAAVQALQRRLEMKKVHFAGVRFGNLNTPDDLAHAGIALVRGEVQP